MKAELNNYRQSPRKVRLVANLVAGQSVNEALRRLKFLTRRASSPLAKLIQSAVANLPVADRASLDDLKVKTLRVDEGVVLRRSRPRARGRAFPIKKRTSRISVTLEPVNLTPKT